MDLSQDEEINRISLWAQKRNMVLLNKETTTISETDKEVTWYNGSPNYQPSNLDYVVASKHMDIRSERKEPKISVLGWPKLPQAQWSDWLSKFSDHAMLYFEVWN